MRNHTSLGLILVLFIFASATFAGGDAKEDAKKVQGTWKVIRAQVDGKDVEAAELKDTKFIFKDDVITFHSLREKNTATFKLNVAKKPRRIDTEVLDGEAKGDVRVGIYDLAGDKLKLCWSRSTTRPMDFATKKGDNFINLELERVKE